MGLFDIFTAKPATQAATDMRNYYGGVQQTGNTTWDMAVPTATNYLESGAGAARTDLGGAYGTATGAVNTGANSALGALGSGYNTAQGYLDQAGGAYQPLSDLAAKYGTATTMGLNALGVNGQTGTDAARSAFQTGPAYNFNLEQGIEAINRRRNMGGMLDSGNADRDSQVFGAGLASNEWDKWQNALNGFVNPELNATAGAASGRAGVFGQQANLANNYGINSAGIETGRAGMLSDLSKWYGNSLSGVDTGEGNALAGLTTNVANSKLGLATNLAQPYANTYKTAADAEMAGSGNLWNLGMQGAKLATGAYGGSQGWTLPKV